MTCVREEIASLNVQLLQNRKAGQKVTVPYKGKPSLRILNFDPINESLLYQRYGLIGNRAPHLVGRYTLAGFFYAEQSEISETVVPYVVLEAKPDQLYADRVTPADMMNDFGRAITGDQDYDAFQIAY